MTPIILYHSRTGFTQQYATWLSESLRCPALPYRERHRVHFILFVTGAAPEGRAQLEAMEQNFTPHEWSRLRPFYLPGGLNYERLGVGDRAMMAVFRQMLRAKEGACSVAYQTICCSFDMADRRRILPIVDACRNL